MMGSNLAARGFVNGGLSDEDVGVFDDMDM